MYGTVARLRLKPGGVEALTRMSEGQEPPPGAVAFYAFQMDADPNEIYMVAVFESRETYAANAQSPEQNAQYQEWAKWFAEEPEWHDGEIVHAERVAE